MSTEAMTEIERINVLLPTELFAGSKDWRVGSIADRVDWLLTMYASAKEEVERLQSALEAQPQQEPVGPKPFGYFQYDIRLDAWVQNRINDKGVAFYTKEKKCTKTKLA